MSNAAKDLGPSRETGTFITEIMERVAAADRAAPPAARSRRGRNTLSICLLLAFIGSSAMNLTYPFRSPGPEVDPRGEELDVRFAIYVVAEGLNAYRVRTGDLPEDLGELNLADEGVGYVRQGTGYILVGMSGENPVRYRDGEDLTPFAEAVGEIFGSQGS